MKLDVYGRSDIFREWVSPKHPEVKTLDVGRVSGGPDFDRLRQEPQVR